MSDYERYECPCGRNHPVGVQCAIGRKASRSFAAPPGFPASSKLRITIGGETLSGEAARKAFKAMPKEDKQSLLDDLRILEMLESATQENPEVRRAGTKGTE